jgi:hypothetical protein
VNVFEVVWTIPDFSMKLPNDWLAVVCSKVSEVVHVAPDQSILLPRRDLLTVTVFAVPNAQSIYTSSCGKGTRDVQFAISVQKPPSAVNQCWSAGVVNVIPELPPQSPELPVIADRFQLPAPAPVISAKSAFVTVTVAAERDRAVPNVLLAIRTRLVALFPFIVKVPVTVTLVERFNTPNWLAGPV